MEHSFAPAIMQVLRDLFGSKSQAVFDSSPLIQYLNLKTASASRGSKSRSSFANHYVIYTLVEDYLRHGFADSKPRRYNEYEGAKFSELLTRARQLPFGAKLQNHAFNSRLNDEFRKFFPAVGEIPVIRNVETQRYWINENLLYVCVGKKTFNIAAAVIKIIESYIDAKTSMHRSFLTSCRKIASLKKQDSDQAEDFIASLLAPSVDARVFEIVSFAILKSYYADQSIYWGFTRTKLQQDHLVLFKTGRTNANDGGIDYVMKPLGRFFQVTETTDVKKYFLDIEKIQRYPLTFVVKTNHAVEKIRQEIYDKASRLFPVKAVVDCLMNCIEEIINIPTLLERFREAVRRGRLPTIVHDLVQQSQLEFPIDEA